MISESAGQLLQILEKTVSPDKNELETAQQFLEQASQQNFPEFLKALSDILYHGGNSPVARMAAGLQLKNTLTSKVSSVRQMHQQRWLALEQPVKDHVKQNIVAALGTENNRPSSAAQCVAYIAIVELPQDQWPDLISTLVNNIIASNATERWRSKEASLETIGYICQDIDAEVLAARSNDMLTAIVHGMKRDEPSNHVRLSATNALFNSLEFTKANFEKDVERHYIMEVICEATQSTDTPIRVAAMQCLVRIMSLYYQYMESYMGPALFAITLDAMKSDVDEIALQGIEFWSTVCDEEVDLEMEAQEAAELGRPPEQTSRFYAKGAVQYLVPVLMERLTKQDDCDDDENWSPCKAASVCLMLMTSCTEDDIVNHVLPFVNQHIRSSDWNYRDAALMAFGAILDGPDTNKLKPLVEQVLPILMELTKDSVVAVKDTAAWTLGRVCEQIPEATLGEQQLAPLLACLVAGLKYEPRVATNISWAISSLSESAYEMAQTAVGGDETVDPDTYCLSKYYDALVEHLLETTARQDGTQNNLRNAAYEALMELLKSAPRDCYATVQKAIMVILDRLDHLLQIESHMQSQSDMSQCNEIQSLLCATLSSVLRKLTPEDAPHISDRIMMALLRMFTAHRSGSVQEEALNAVSTLAVVLGEQFIKYLDAFKPFLLVGLRNHAEYRVCSVAVGLVGDICRAVGPRILPYCDDIMNILLENLGNQAVHRSVKPPVLTEFGDIALAVGTEFKKYLDVVLQTLMQASQAQVDRSDYEMVEYLNSLREACLEAYTGIIQGLKGLEHTPSADVALLQPHVAYIVQFICVVAADSERSESSLCAAAGLIGDLISVFGSAIMPLVDNDAINEMLSQGRRGKASRTKTLSTWAAKELRKLKTNTLVAAG